MDAKQIRNWPQCMGHFARYHPLAITNRIYFPLAVSERVSIQKLLQTMMITFVYLMEHTFVFNNTLDLCFELSEVFNENDVHCAVFQTWALFPKQPLLLHVPHLLVIVICCLSQLLNHCFIQIGCYKGNKYFHIFCS